MPTLTELINKCIENDGLNQIKDNELNLKLCSYVMILPCKYQGRPYTGLEGNIYTPCIYVKEEEK